MINDKYNYKLNGIEHEIILNHNLKIDQKPINDKILVSNKIILDKFKLISSFKFT
jgi:hypothetical protein